MKIETNVMYVQARNYWLCLHVGSIALFFGEGRMNYSHRIELVTPKRWFRWSRGKK